MGIRPTSFLGMISMQYSKRKFVAILVIFCISAYENNSNYFLLFDTLYLYSDGARIDAINLFNYWRICISYDIRQKRLKAIVTLDMTWIINCRFVRMENNFEYQEKM